MNKFGKRWGLNQVADQDQISPAGGLWLGLLLSLATSAGAFEAHTQARLLLAYQTVQPGQTFLAGVHLQMAPGWHTYWRYSGDSGAPTTIEWTLPEGFIAGAIQWPVPEKHTEAGFTTYVYHDEVILLVPISVGSQVPFGRVEFHAKVAWLECETMCLPGDATVSNTVLVAAESTRATASSALADWQQRLPIRRHDLSLPAQWAAAAESDPRQLVVDLSTIAGRGPWDFFPVGHEQYEIMAETRFTTNQAGQARLEMMVKRFEPAWPEQITGILVGRDGGDAAPLAYEVQLEPDGDEASRPDTVASDTVAKSEPGSSVTPWLLMLWYAFLGGLILNIMPCVLPVIALKVLGFVNQAQSDPARVRRLGWIYAGGVLLSFLALSVAAIGVQWAGHLAGWGMQFGNPQFLVILTTLVTLVALNLFGIFEVTLSSQVLGKAATLSAQEGASGAFFNGVLATLLATPCTAPYLGSALGFAFTQSPAVIMLMFLTIGAGLATPYVVLSWKPGWLKFLPKPGAWMERFKQAMGFPLLATAVWLFHLTPRHYGARMLWLGLFLVILSLAAWIFGEFVQRGRHRRGLALGLTLVLLVFDYGYVLEAQLRWRSPLDTAASVIRQPASPDGISWQPWSADAVAQARAAGRPVLVDFTADWCLTCQANKKVSIEIPAVQQKLKEINAVALLGDYTTVSPIITAELARFGRRGVPLVLVYPRNPERLPQVLPELLTPAIVIQALETAAQP